MSPDAETPDPAAEAGHPDRPRLVLVTGLSGSGKSTAIKALEDVGYYCIDNLPLPLLRTFLRDPLALAGSYRKIAVVTDVRAPGFAEAAPEVLTDVDRRRYDFTLLFLDASEAALVRRFSETRRTHPLAGAERPVVEGIRLERELLAELRGVADLVFDSSDWTVHDFRREVIREFGGEGEVGKLVVSLLSFGFKHGLPAGSDLVFDVRFLPNPYFRPELREKTGRDPEVREFLEAQEDYREFVRHLDDFLGFLLPRYRLENRSYLTVAIGCTGGRHRSVAISEHLAKSLKSSASTIRLSHRDCDR